MATTGSVALAPEVKTLYDGDYYIQGQSRLYFDQLCDLKFMMDGRRGSTFEFPLIGSNQPTTATLDELSDVVPQVMRANAISIPLNEYGGAVELTKYLVATSYSEPLRQAAEVNGYSFAESMDMVVRAVVGQGARVFRTNGRTARSSFAGPTTSADRLSVSFIERLTMILARTFKMPMYEDGSILAVLHPFNFYDLMQSTDVRTMSTRLTPELLYNGELAYWAGMRMVVSNNAKAFWGAGAANGTAVNTTTAAAAAVGDGAITVNSATNITAGNWLNVVDATETGNTWTDTNELVQVTSVSGTVVNFFALDGGPGNTNYVPGGLRYAHPSGTTINNNYAAYPVCCLGPNSILKVASDITGPWGETVVTGPFDRLGRFINLGWYLLAGYARTVDMWLLRGEVGASEI